MAKNYKYKAVLFDFDGTLYDTWPGLALALKKTYQTFTNEDIDVEKLKKYSFFGRKKILTKLFNRDATANETDSFIKIYTDCMLSNIIPYQGIYKTVNFFNDQLIPWGIVTNKPRNYLDLFAKHEPILKSSSCIICPQDVTKGKPHPEPLQAACKNLKIKPQEAVFIGDSVHDIEAANSCNMDCGLALYGHGGDIDSLSDLKINYYLKSTLWEIVDFLDRS